MSEEKKSYRLVASLIQSEDGDVNSGRFILGFRPEGRGTDVADALITATTAHLGPTGKVVDVSLEHTLTEHDNGLFVHIAHIVSGSRCPTCGAQKHAPRAWCEDAEGCEKFRHTDTKPAAPSADKTAMLNRLAKLVG